MTNDPSPRSGRQRICEDALQSQRLPLASAGSRFLINRPPGVPLRSTPGFMLSCASRTFWSSQICNCSWERVGARAWTNTNRIPLNARGDLALRASST